MLIWVCILRNIFSSYCYVLLYPVVDIVSKLTITQDRIILITVFLGFIMLLLNYNDGDIKSLL